MDHVIESLKRWKEVYEDQPENEIDKKALRCIDKALEELYKYYDRK